MIDHASDKLAMARAVVSSLPDAALLIDRELKPLHYNAQYVQLTGQRARQVSQTLQTADSAFTLVAHEARRDRQNGEQCLALGQTIHMVDVQVHNVIGESFTMMQTFMPVKDEVGQAIGVILVFRDVSAEARVHVRYKELIAQEKARAEDLERQVTERTRQLTVALEEVTRLSRTDPLTGVLNRRAFAEYAAQALKLASRHNRGLAIVMFDLDHFKQLNDTFGHQAGDEMLLAVSHGLIGMVRDTDRVARFGGEEFVVLLNEADQQGALLVANRCRQMVRDLRQKGAVPSVKREQTVSAGIAVYPTHGTELNELIGRADRALYHAKETGRNRVVVYSPVLDEDKTPVRIRYDHENKRVLLVDHDAKRVDSYRNFLSRTYQVTVANTADDALVLCSRQDFDALVADEDVSPDGGIEFFRRSLTFASGAMRVLIIKTEDAYLAIRGTNVAHADHFLLRGEAPTHLTGAIEDGLLRRQFAREQLLEQIDIRPTVQPKHIEALREIIDDNNIYMVYQPILEGKHGKIWAYEALCRTNHTELRGPETLFETALRVGSLWTLGCMVRQTVVDDIPRFEQEPLIFINLHPAEIDNQELLACEAFMRPWTKRIVFEITERSAIPDLARFKDDVTRLRDHGFRVAIDDLGAGYASLNSVALLEPDFVKVDMALIHRIEQSSRKRNLVRSIVDFANAEGIQVIAEGVETAEEARVVNELGCHMMQGYFFGRPTRF